MPEYLAPGVFVEEVSFRPSQIQPASTSVAAIVGPTRTGPTRGAPQLLTSFNDYVSIFGDPGDLNFGGTSTPNYTAYAARAFFDNGGQMLYLSRVVNDYAGAGPASGRPAFASLPISTPGSGGAAGTVLATFNARFPGAAGNLNLVFTPRRSQKLLRLSSPPPAGATGPFLLNLSNVPSSAFVGLNSAVPAAAFPLQSLTAVVTPAPAPAPPAGGGGAGGAGAGGAGGGGAQQASYNFVNGQPVIYVDQSGTSHTAQIAAFATGVLTSVAPASALSTVASQSPAGIGQAPVYSIPVGPALRSIFGLPATVATLYATLSGATATLPQALNPALSADTSAPLPVLAMSSRAGDGNLFHDSYDISVLSNGVEINVFPDVDLEPDATRSLYAILTPNPTGSALATQPVSVLPGSPAPGPAASALLAAILALPNAAAALPNFSLTLSNGADGASPQFADYDGEVDQLLGSYGLASLESVDEISMVLCPAAAADPNVHQAVIAAIQAHCMKMLYRVGIIESPPGAAIADAQQFAGQFSDTRLAFYYPWISAASLGPNGGQILLPPSGFMAGMYAYTDITRGVHKAPANEVVQEALGLETYVNTAQQMVLNPHGVNCIRSFPGRGIRAWGARTLSADPQWQYVNVRRYFLYLEHSIADSTSWVVFEPNGQALWSAVATTVSDFLYNEWFNGRLLGDKANQAYFVRCDRTTMTEADLENGRLICVIGVAPLEPAEFVIFRIGQWTASA